MEKTDKFSNFEIATNGEVTTYFANHFDPSGCENALEAELGRIVPHEVETVSFGLIRDELYVLDIACRLESGFYWSMSYRGTLSTECWELLDKIK